MAQDDAPSSQEAPAKTEQPVLEQPVAEKPQEVVPVTVQAKSTEAPSLESAKTHVNEGLGKIKDYTPLFYGIGKRALIGAAWGGAFGLVVFKSAGMRKFSLLYGAGFGLGMCAPTIQQLQKEFFDDSHENNDSASLLARPKSDQDFYSELDTIRQEIVLRNKFKH